LDRQEPLELSFTTACSAGRYEHLQQSVQNDFGWQPDLFNERARKKHAAGAPRRRLGYEELLWSHGRAGHIGPPKAWIRQTFEKDQEVPV
jgi:hypothetical protein